MNFRYLNFYTAYKANLKEDGNSLPPFVCDYRASCFASLFSSYDNMDIYSGYVSMEIYDSGYRNKMRDNNAMLLTMDEFYKYLGDLKKVVDFEYEIAREPKYFTIKVMVEGITHFKNKWLLSSIRNVYEYPQNVAIKEAITMRDEGLFPEEDNIINIFNVVMRSSVPSMGGQVVSRLSETEAPGLLTLEELKNRISLLEREESGKLNSLYPCVNIKFSNLIQARKEKLRDFYIDEYPEGKWRDNEKEDLFFRFKLIHNPIYKEIKRLQKNK